jgi:hypothetical protein
MSLEGIRAQWNLRLRALVVERSPEDNATGRDE